MHSTPSTSAFAVADASPVMTTDHIVYAGGVLSSLRMTDGRTVRARRPKPGNEYTPSIYRPFVPAQHRIFMWTSPYAIIQKTENQELIPDRALAHMEQVILASVDVRTRVVNASGLLRFTQYCDEFAIPEISRMPASDTLLAAFVSSGAAKVSSAQHWVDGLRLWHEVHGAPWLGGPLLARALTGVKKLAPASSHRLPRPPVTFEHMEALLRGLNFSNTKDCAVWAAAAVAFWSCCRSVSRTLLTLGSVLTVMVPRLGELLIPSPGTFDPHKHVARSSALKKGVTRDGDNFFSLHIPFSKTTGSAGADISIIESSDPTSPFSALDYHLRVNSNLPDSAPLFSFRQDDNWVPLTKISFLRRCNEV